MRRRPAVLLALGFAAFVFLGLSALLARGLTGAGTERTRVLDVVRAQAAGDAQRMLADLPDCRAEPACARLARARARRLRRAGTVEILTYRPSVRLALTRRTGTGRVAWRAGRGLPVVQCVRVRRDGPLTGGGVTLLALSDPVEREAGC